MALRRRPGSSSASRNTGGSPRGLRGSGIRRSPPPPPRPPGGPRPVSVYDDDPDDSGWGDQGGDWDEAPRRPASRRGGSSARGRGGRGGRGRRGGRGEQSSEGAGAFVCAILGWVLCAPLLLVGLILALSAVGTAKSRGMQPNGLATAAVWLSAVGMVFWVLVIAALVFMRH